MPRPSGAPPLSFEALTRADLDLQFSPSRTAKDAAGVLARHEAETAALDGRPGLRVRRDLPYGPRPAARLDLVAPADGGPRPCLVWVHGGFWQEGSKAGSGFAAATLASAGWAHASVGYSLTPEVRVRDIVDEIAAAVRLLAQEAARLGLDPGCLVLGGHSAGAHLAASVMAGLAGDDAAEAVAGAVLVSGVYDLAPVAASYVNEQARLDAADVADLSPIRVLPARDVPVHVLVGADEPAAFQQQSDALQAAWAPHLSRLSAHRAPGRDHFDVLDELADASSATFGALLEMRA